MNEGGCSSSADARSNGLAGDVRVVVDELHVA
jgi:hypothetical protein